ncbi:MAG TPA: hypothetical protein VFR12_02645 [Pyrinomonadaceae bacterium]|nr:hypothetical protein [Pyrinomonadaceae bacterium]
MSLSTITRRGPEISDAIVSFDPITLQRKPVKKADVLAQFEELANHEAVSIVRQIPERDGALDPTAVDNLLIASHCELQRMSEEFLDDCSHCVDCDSHAGLGRRTELVEIP